MLQFTNSDQPDAAKTLRMALASMGNVPVIGLLIKMTDSGDIVNWQFADAQTVKSLAFVLPGGDQQSTVPDEE